MDFANMTTSDIEKIMLDNAMSRHQRLSQPDDKAKWLAIAQAMGSPTRTGSFGEGLGNIAGALGTYNTGEQGRRESADEAMEKALALVYKQKMDLAEKKAKVQNDSKPKFFQTSEGTFGFANPVDNTIDVRAVGPAQMKIVEKLQNRYIDILSKQGTFTDAGELQDAAYKLAMRDYSRMINDTKYTPAEAGISSAVSTSPDQGRIPPVARAGANPGGFGSNGSIPGQPQLDPMAPVAAVDMSKFKNVGKGLQQPVGGVMSPDSDNVFGEPTSIDPTNDPRFSLPKPANTTIPPLSGKDDPASALKAIENHERVAKELYNLGKIDRKGYDQRMSDLSSAKKDLIGDVAKGPSVPLLTPQQVETNKGLAAAHVKENAEDRSNLESLRKLENNRSVMAEIINSGKNTSGLFHEYVNKAGGIMNYIDPDSSLAQYAGNDAVYFSKMMDLVRDKIKALGAGTAVSNLDLIVSQKSVGDLRNTPEGNKKLLAIMELQNATIESKLNNKLDYFDQSKSYDKYRGDPSSTHIVRATTLPSGEVRYWIQTRDGWINERIKKGDYKSPEAAKQAFESATTKATASLISGTGIKMNQRKEK